MDARDEYLNVQTWICGCQRPLLLTHRKPDGDALGALAAMSLGLRALGLDPRPTLNEPFPMRYALLEGGVRWWNWAREGGSLRAECDAVIVLDTCAWSQLEDFAEHLRHAPRTLVIDHHATRDSIGTRPGDLCVVDESAGATCLILAEWLRAVGVSLTPECATALFVGVATDCGWFRFANTDARMLRTAGELADAGAAVAPAYRAIYEQDAPGRLRLIGRMLAALELECNGKLAVLKLRRKDFEAAGADRTMTEDIVNEAGRLAGVEGVILFVEEADGTVRVNFRSKERLDVAALASQFGGGGHTRAAGARTKGTWDEVVRGVLAAARTALGTFR